MRSRSVLSALVLSMLILALAVSPAWSQNHDTVGGPAGEVQLPDGPPTWFWPEGGGTVLWDNGPLVNSPGTGAGGADESMLQNSSLGMNTLGVRNNHSVNTDRISDDFMLAEDAFLETCTLFHYQTGAPTTSTITSINLQIWDGSPDDPGSSVVFGDTSTNRLETTDWSGIYRVAETTSGDTTRAVFASTVRIDTDLTAGSYWLDYSADGSASFSGPWQPPITIDGQTTTGDSIVSSDGGSTWGPWEDSGTFTQQGLPFICEGQLGPADELPIPTLSQVGLIALLLALAAAGVLRLRLA